jgi:Mrp family chromosome partitioning ATPase
VHAIRRLWWLVGAGVVVGAGVGAALMLAVDPVYSSSVSVLVAPVDGEPNMQTEAQLVRSTRTVADARAVMGGVADALPSVEAVPGTSVLVIRFEARSPGAAQVGAQAFAEAYLNNRSLAGRAAVNEEIAAVLPRLDELNNQIGEINTLIATLPSNSPQLATLRSTLTALTTQASSLTARMNELQTQRVNPGQIIADANLPSAPVRPLPWIYLGAGGLAGALLGSATVPAVARWSRRVRSGADLHRHNGVTLLAELDAVSIGTGPQHPSARAFNRIRNEVVATLRDGDRTLLVTGASSGPASMLVAANLAAAFARAESDVVLVGASVPQLGPDFAHESTTLSQIFDVADVPGLTDVLSGRTSLAHVVQRAARSPRLRVITPGGTASSAGLLQSEGARGVLSALARQARYVVIEAPSTAAGADAQSLASVADAALVVVEAGRTHHQQVVDAVTQLRRVGTRLLGAVVVPRVTAWDVGRPRGHASRPGHGFSENSASEYVTEAWITTKPTALDAPTRALDQVTRREPPPPHDASGPPGPGSESERPRAEDAHLF